jgi:hypothetical protein
VNPWLGARRGHLSDWTTQQWVRATGRRVDLHEEAWLDGLSAPTTGIGEQFFGDLAPADGLLPSFAALRSPTFDPGAVDPRVVAFYERTAHFRLQLWSQWSPVHRPFGRLIDRIFAQRLGQLRLPLAPLDTSRGVAQELLSLPTGTAWLRRRLPEREVLFAGLYSVGRPRLAAGPCVKTVFPLPNGFAAIFLVPRGRPDGSLELVSPPGGFGEPGFYFVVRDGDRAWTRTVKAMTEQLHIYVEGSELHADHALRLWGRPFLRLHYAMQPHPTNSGC